MTFSAPFIARPVATFLLALGILLAGIVASRFLPVSALPSVDIPTIVVFAGRPGADPETMANSIAAPLERRLGEIAGVTELTSISAIGNTTIIIQFDIDRDINGAAHDVQAAINAATTDLPSDLPWRPFYRKFNPADAPVMTIALSSDTLSTAQIYDAADTILAQRLSQAEGVSQVQVNGAEKPAVRVRLDPQRLAAAGVAAQDVYTAIRGTSVLEPTGGFEGPERAETISINGQLSQAAEYAPLVIKAGNGAVLRLSDVATVIDGTANTRLGAWNGKTPAILLNISKEAGANVIDTADRIRELLPQLMAWLPPDIKLTVVSDRTTTIRASVTDVQYTLGITIVLVLLVVLLFMRRLVPTIAAAVTVPLSICGTLAGMWFLGYTHRQLLVDGADDFRRLRGGRRHRHDREHRPPHGKGHAALAGRAGRRAADRLHRGVDQYFSGRGVHSADLHGRHPGPAVPRIRHGDDPGDRHLRGGIAVADADAVRPLHAGAGTSARAVLGQCRSRQWKPASVAACASTRARSAGRCGTSVFMLLVTVLTVVLTVRLYMSVPKGFLPLQDTGILVGSTQASPDISFTAMEDRQRAVVDVLLADPAVATVSSWIGVGSGWSSMNRGWLTLSLKPLAERRHLIRSGDRAPARAVD